MQKSFAYGRGALIGEETMWQRLSQNPLFRGGLGVVIALLIGSFFVRSKPKLPPEVGRVDAMVKESAGFVAGQEAARLLGGSGKVFLLLPLEERDAAIYRKAFEEALPQKSGIKVVGDQSYRLPIQEDRQTEKGLVTIGYDGPSWKTLQQIRSSHPEAELLVSFINLPQFSSAEVRMWRGSAPPKIIVLQHPQLSPQEEEVMKSGIIQVLLLRKPKVAPPLNLPQDLRERFLLLYEIRTP